MAHNENLAHILLLVGTKEALAIEVNQMRWRISHASMLVLCNSPQSLDRLLPPASFLCNSLL